MIKIVSLIVLFATIASADLYLHNPRGSNDRNCERNDNRNNGNRLFDSQNNDKGGYACPRPVSPDVLPNENTMYYYEGSKLMLEWTAQHGCGDVDTGYCAIIIQYMCEDQNPLIRDGTPNDDQDSATDRMNAGQETQSRYGYHETSAYYKRCATRERNKGLYVADQNLGNSATSTRQNPNANRRGWECPEERDYYPYWHPAPWKDIAIVSTNFGQDGYPSCDYFKKNSQNNKKFGECFTADSEAVLTAKDADPNTVMDAEGVTPLKYNNEAECTSNGGYWYVRDSLGGGDPDCVGQLPVRPNSLGDDATGNMVNYVWTIPNLKPPQRSNGATQPGMKCVLRMRYNISTWETPWNLDATANDNQDEDQYQGPNEDPYIQPFAPFVADSLSTLMNTNVDGAYNLSLALNTDQYGRTFQDRSYTFFIRSRSTGMPTPGGGAPNSGEIWNVNVRGKRGNIVQTFPAVEYDFVPQHLQVTVGDHIHFQWTGSDYNPDRQPNNAEGGPEDLANSNTYRADRSNLVQLSENSPKQNIPMDFDEKKGASAFFGSNDARRMAFLDQDIANDCDDYETLLSNNNGNADQADKDRRNCYKLNAQKTPYFDGGVVKADKTGTFHFVSSRNNNFSNRSQKMKITVHPLYSAGEVAGITIGTIAGVGAAACLGGFAYAKKYPGSRVAGVYNSALSHPLLNRFH